MSKTFNYVQKMSSSSFKNVINKMCLEIIYLIYKKNLELDNLRWLICQKIKLHYVSMAILL